MPVCERARLYASAPLCVCLLRLRPCALVHPRTAGRTLGSGRLQAPGSGRALYQTQTWHALCPEAMPRPAVVHPTSATQSQTQYVATPGCKHVFYSCNAPHLSMHSTPIPGMKCAQPLQVGLPWTSPVSPSAWPTAMNAPKEHPAQLRSRHDIPHTLGMTKDKMQCTPPHGGAFSPSLP